VPFRGAALLMSYLPCCVRWYWQDVPTRSNSYRRYGICVFNRTLPLKDSWAKIEKKSGA